MTCQVWEGCTNSSGYGTQYDPSTKKPDMAHRVAYRKAKGSIPEGMVVMHSCANKLCVNPDHLSLGTQHENRMEMVSRGVSGEQKLTTEDVDLIRWCHRQGSKVYGWQKAVRESLGVSRSCVAKILSHNSFVEV